MSSKFSPSDKHAYREEYQGIVPKLYNPYAFFGMANGVVIASIVGAAFLLRNLQAVELLTVPAAFLIANFVEWAAHRGPLHNRRDFMDMLFERHTLLHHNYFLHDDMSISSDREWYMVLFPTWAVVLVFLIALPIAGGFGLAFGWNAGVLFFMTAMGYYILYEWLHLVYHFREDHWLVKTRLVSFLRQHHAHHHNKRLMQRYNFNVIFPIFDYVFGTAYNPAKHGIPGSHAPQDEGDSLTDGGTA